MKLSKWKLALAMILFGLIFGAILAEAALRITGPNWLKVYMRGTNLYGALQYGSDAGWPIETLNHKFVKFKPNQTFNVDYYEYKTTIHTDRWGGRTVSGKSDEKALYIPFVGDSFAFGLGVQDSQTYVSLINHHPKWQALNLGVPGSSIPNQLDIIAVRHRELNSPRLYVFSFFTGNDIVDIMKYYGFKTETSFQSTDHAKPEDFITHNRLLARSYLFQFLDRVSKGSEESTNESRSHKRSLIFRTPSGKRIASSIFLMMSGSKGYRKAADAYLNKALERLTELSKEMRFTPYFVIIPEKHQVEPARFRAQASHYGLSTEELDRELPDKMIIDLLNHRGIEAVDTLPCLINRSGLYYEVDDHLTPAGHAAVAQCIDETLNRKILSVYGEQ